MSIVSKDGEQIGEVERVVISPVSYDLESLVVKQGILFAEERIIPIHLIDQIDQENVRLTINSDALQSLPRYQETHYIDSLASDRGDPGSTTLYYLHPVDPIEESNLLPNYPSPPIVERTIENIPPGSYVLEEADKVLDRSGEQIGEVEQIVADPETKTVTHFVISEDLLFETKKLIPSHWTDSVADGRVKLAVEKELIQRLPDYQD
jgi:uncharacterized protein YrrD